MTRSEENSLLILGLRCHLGRRGGTEEVGTNGAFAELWKTKPSSVTDMIKNCRKRFW